MRNLPSWLTNLLVALTIGVLALAFCPTVAAAGTDLGNSPALLLLALWLLVLGLPVPIWYSIMTGHAVGGVMRPICMLHLFACAIAAFIAGGLLGALGAFLSAATMLALVVSALAGLYGSAAAAFGHLGHLVLGMANGIQIVEDGRSVLPRGGGPVLGPHMLIVKPYNAVVLEQGGRQTQIEGSHEIIHTHQFEYVKRIYDLRPKQEPLVLDDVLTQDGIATTVSLSIGYGIDIRPRAARGEAAFGPQDRDAIQHLEMLLPDVSAGIHSLIATHVRRLAGTQTLQQLVPLANPAAFGHELRMAVRDMARAWGIHIDHILVEGIQPKPEIIAATTGLWLANVRATTNIILERSRGQAWIEALTNLANAYANARSGGLSEEQIRWETGRKTLEQIAKDIAEAIA